MRAINVRLSTSLLALVVLIDAGGASADLCDGAALLVGARGLSFVAEQVRPLIPRQLVIPPITQTVVDWPLTDADAKLQLDGLSATLEVRELKLSAQDGALVIVAEGDVSAHGPVKVLNPYMGFGDADCQADFVAPNLALTTTATATIHPASGKLRVHVVDARLSLDASKTTIVLQGCTLGSVLEAVTGALRAHFIAAAEAALGTIARDQLGALVESQLDVALGLSGESDGLRYSVQLSSLTTDENGLRAGISGAVEPQDQIPAACLAGLTLPAAPACAPPGVTLPPLAQAMFGAAVSQNIVRQVLWSLWRSGRLCLDSRSLPGPLIGESLSRLAAALGQPAGTELLFQVRLKQPPGVSFAATGARLELRDLLVDLALQAPGGGPAGRVAIAADLAVAVEPWVDPASNSIAISLRSASVARLEAIGQRGNLALDPARLQRFVTEVALPVLQQRLAELQLSPAVIDAAHLFFVELRQVQVADGSVAAYFDAYPAAIATGDTKPPRTVLVSGPGPLVGPQVVQVFVTGTDDKTPPGLLRYRARVDGGTWSTPSFSRRVDVVVGHGAHVIEVAAVDLPGNADATPVQVRVVVDDQPPTLELTAAPPAILLEPHAEVRFRGSDDRTSADQLVYQLELLRIPEGGGAPAQVEARPYRAGISQGAFEALADGLYRIRITVRDEAGNVTSQDVGFAVYRDAGCSIGAAPPVRPRPLLLGLLGLVVALLAPLALHRHRRSARPPATSATPPATPARHGAPGT